MAGNNGPALEALERLAEGATPDMLARLALIKDTLMLKWVTSKLPYAIAHGAILACPGP